MIYSSFIQLSQNVGDFALPWIKTCGISYKANDSTPGEGARSPGSPEWRADLGNSPKWWGALLKRLKMLNLVLGGWLRTLEGVLPGSSRMFQAQQAEHTKWAIVTIGWKPHQNPPGDSLPCIYNYHVSYVLTKQIKINGQVSDILATFWTPSYFVHYAFIMFHPCWGRTSPVWTLPLPANSFSMSAVAASVWGTWPGRYLAIEALPNFICVACDSYVELNTIIKNTLLNQPGIFWFSKMCFLLALYISLLGIQFPYPALSPPGKFSWPKNHSTLAQTFGFVWGYKTSAVWLSHPVSSLTSSKVTVYFPRLIGGTEGVVLAISWQVLNVSTMASTWWSWWTMIQWWTLILEPQIYEFGAYSLDIPRFSKLVISASSSQM